MRASILAVVLLAAACGSAETGTVAIESDGDAADTSAEPAASDEAGHDDDEGAEHGGDDNDSGADHDESDTDGDGDSDGDAEEPAAASSPPVSLPPEEAAAAATENLPNLQQSDDIRDLEILSVTSGGITTLRDVVDGDRPVLVWFWAPH